MICLVIKLGTTCAIVFTAFVEIGLPTPEIAQTSFRKISYYCLMRSMRNNNYAYSHFQIFSQNYFMLYLPFKLLVDKSKFYTILSFYNTIWYVRL